MRKNGLQEYKTFPFKELQTNTSLFRLEGWPENVKFHSSWSVKEATLLEEGLVNNKIKPIRRQKLSTSSSGQLNNNMPQEVIQIHSENAIESSRGGFSIFFFFFFFFFFYQFLYLIY